MSLKLKKETSRRRFRFFFFNLSHKVRNIEALAITFLSVIFLSFPKTHVIKFIALWCQFKMTLRDFQAGFHEKNIRLREEEKFLRILSSNGEWCSTLEARPLENSLNITFCLWIWKCLLYKNILQIWPKNCLQWTKCENSESALSSNSRACYNYIPTWMHIGTSILFLE